MKGEHNLTSFLFALLIVAAIISGCSIFATDVIVTHYPVTGAENVTRYSTMTYLNRTANLTSDIDSSIRGLTETNNPLVAVGYAISGGWQTFLIFFNVPSVFYAMYTDMSTATPILVIPSWFTTLIFTCVMLIIIIAGLKFARGGDAGL
jgi:hypothetical protein